MSSSQLKEDLLNSHIQQVEITRAGVVIQSDNVLFALKEGSNIAYFHPFFETIVGLLPTISEDTTYPCVNIEAGNIRKILDINIVHRKNSIYILLFDFTQHYQDAHPLIQEKNEAAIEKYRLSFDKKLLLEKEQFKNTFLSNLNHEIRNPLNNLLGFMELFRKTKLSYNQSETLKIMQRTGHQMKHLLDDMLDISKIERGALQTQHLPFNLGHVIANLQQHFDLKFGDKNISLETNIHAAVPKKLLGDPFKLNQILFNLLENAYRNTKRGTIMLQVVVVEKANSSCILDLSVSDSGIGIPDSEIDHIFETYHQLQVDSIKPIGEGLGLKIVKDLVTLLHGKISVSSDTTGTIFTCQLPFEMREKKKKRPSVPKGSGILISKRVLVVEDVETNQMLFMRTFLNNDKGYVLEIAQNAAQAFQLLEKKTYKLLIIKHKLTDSTGSDFIKKCKQNEKFKEIPILVASGNTMKKEQEKIVASGASGFLSKPYTQKELFDCIEKLSS